MGRPFHKTFAKLAFGCIDADVANNMLATCFKIYSIFTRLHRSKLHMCRFCILSAAARKPCGQLPTEGKLGERNVAAPPAQLGEPVDDLATTGSTVVVLLRASAALTCFPRDCSPSACSWRIGEVLACLFSCEGDTDQKRKIQYLSSISEQVDISDLLLTQGPATQRCPATNRTIGIL